MATLLLELALTRIFSVVFYYHFAFLAISIALFGLGLGGVFSYVVAGWKAPLFTRLGRLSVANSMFVMVALIILLAQGERNVTSLCQELDLPQPTVSHHLGLLRMNNLIGNRRDGKQVYYGINGRFETPAENALAFAVENYSIQVSPSGKDEER